MQQREIKFRQRNSKGGWHYWGYIDGHFVGPLETFGIDGGDNNQFTGLHDKNGKEIYEGDIVVGQLIHTLTKRIQLKGVMEYYKGGFALGHENVYKFDMQDFEVIGNIYENPELIN
jgi:hypothetical protein